MVQVTELVQTHFCWHKPVPKHLEGVTFPPRYLDRYNSYSQGSLQAPQPLLSTLANAMTMLLVCFRPVWLLGTQKYMLVHTSIGLMALAKLLQNPMNLVPNCKSTTSRTNAPHSLSVIPLILLLISTFQWEPMKQEFVRLMVTFAHPGV